MNPESKRGNKENEEKGKKKGIRDSEKDSKRPGSSLTRSFPDESDVS